MEHISIEPKSLHINLFGILEVTDTLATAVLASLILILFAVAIRIFFIPKFTEKPGKLQMILEMAVEGIQAFTDNSIGTWASKSIAPYIFTVGAFILVNGILELMGLRAAMTDLNSTIALSLITFSLIQVYALKKKGIIGRLKHYRPYYLAPVKVVTELAIPVSLSCRLFGNILGGMVVMEILYGMWATKFVFPAFLSIYFTLFHTLMQAFIFITLSLTFIDEALE